jgi:ABC-type glutathione transport system ATPase component
MHFRPHAHPFLFRPEDRVMPKHRASRYALTALLTAGALVIAAAAGPRTRRNLRTAKAGSPSSAVPPVRRSRLRDYRHTVQMVFQDPFASLNPYHSIEHHLARPLQIHGKGKDGVHELLERVQLTPADVMARRRPHELSGGQPQRVAIARALAPGPGILIADEPVSMLDVSIRLGVLNLLSDLQREENLGVLYMTHDLATARHFSDEIMVMHRGQIVERGPSDQVILDPQHDYTKLLLQAPPNPEKHFSRS